MKVLNGPVWPWTDHYEPVLLSRHCCQLLFQWLWYYLPTRVHLSSPRACERTKPFFKCFTKRILYYGFLQSVWGCSYLTNRVQPLYSAGSWCNFGLLLCKSSEMHTQSSLFVLNSLARAIYKASCLGDTGASNRRFRQVLNASGPI